MKFDCKYFWIHIFEYVKMDNWLSFRYYFTVNTKTISTNCAVLSGQKTQTFCTKQLNELHNNNNKVIKKRTLKYMTFEKIIIF